LVQQVSQGVFAAGASAEDVKAGKYGFDPGGEFLLNYNSRRAALEESAQSNRSFFVE
jgi:hypothetical protein